MFKTYVIVFAVCIKLISSLLNYCTIATLSIEITFCRCIHDLVWHKSIKLNRILVALKPLRTKQTRNYDNEINIVGN